MITFKQKKPSDDFPEKVTLVSHKTGESITLDKKNLGFFPKFVNLLSKLLLGGGYKNRIHFDILCEGKTVGLLDLDHWSKDELHIEWIRITKEEFRGKGYARVILETVIEWAKEMGYKKISLEAPYGYLMDFLDTSPFVKKFYRTLGFKKTKDEGEGLLTMERKL